MDMDRRVLALGVVLAGVAAGCFESGSYDDDDYPSSGHYGPCGASPCSGSSSSSGGEAAPVAPPAGGLRAFVTEAGYAGDLAAAGAAADGLAGADALCEREAKSAGLTGRWAAWLSTSTVDAKDRIDSAPKGYYDVRGRFIGTRADLVGVDLSSFVDMGPRGGVAYGSARVGWTGSSALGTRRDATCRDWTSSDPRVTGATAGYDYGYGAGGAAPCSTAERLFCFERSPLRDETDAGTSDGGDGAARPDGDGGDGGAPAAKKRVFVSSTRHSGQSLHDALAAGGAPGVDAICNGLAATAGMDGAYHAWISARDSATGPVTPLARVSLTRDYWDAARTTKIFAPGAFATPLAPVTLTESGQRAAEGEELWTGDLSRAFCTEFAGAGGGAVRLATAGRIARDGWQDGSGLRACEGEFRILCFEE
jgi:hypothetical protein